MTVWISKFMVKRWMDMHGYAGREMLCNGFEKAPAEELWATGDLENNAAYKVHPVRGGQHELMDAENMPRVNPNDAFDFDEKARYTSWTFEFNEVAWDLRQMVVFVNFMLAFVRKHKHIITHAILVQKESAALCVIRDNVIEQYEEYASADVLNGVMARMLADSTLRDERRKEFIEHLEDKMKELKRWELVDFIKDIFFKNEEMLSAVVQRSFTQPVVDTLVERVVNPLINKKRRIDPSDPLSLVMDIDS